METIKQDIPDTIWIGFGRKDAAIVRDEARFLKVFRDWMYPHKFKVKHLEFWPGYAWGTIKMESPEARNILLKHVVEKPFRPDNESGWVLNKFEKCVPIFDSSPKKSPAKKPSVASAATAVVASVAIKQRRATVADNLISKANNQATKGRKSRSSTASPATVVNYNEVLDLDDVDKNPTQASFEEDEDDSELRVKATITKVVNGVKVVEALTKKHGIYKLSISDIVGASKYKPNDLTGAIIVIVLGPMKKNQRRRDFLRAEISDDWSGPTPTSSIPEQPPTPDVENGHNEEGLEQPGLVKEETLENALVNLKRFYKWSIKDDQEAKRTIAALLDEVDNAGTIQEKIAVISDHLTLASQSFNVHDADDDSIEELITSTRCSSAFSDVKRVVGSVDYDKDDKIIRNEEYRRSDIVVKEETLEEKLKQMQTFMPEDENEDEENDPKNILNLCDSPVPPPKKANKQPSSGNEKKNVYDLPTSRQTIKANASSYTVESSAEIQIDMMYWQKMLHWLTIHHFDHHGEHAKDHAKWVVIVWELAGITPTNLKSEILGHQQTVTNFCTRLAEILESKKNKIPFWNNLSISNIIHATLCYLLSKSFPAESVPRCMSRLFSTVPYINSKSGSVYQMRGYVDKYISDEKGLLMSPKGYVLFNSYAIKINDQDETSLTVPTGTHVLFNAVKVEDSVLSEDGKRYKYFVATNVWIDNDMQVYYDDLAKQVNVLQTSVMAKVLHRANSNLSDEAILSMYEDGLSKVGKNQGKIDLKDLLVDKATMDSLQPLVDFLRTRLELRLEMASNMSLMYASMWARIGYDLDYLRDDFHSLNAIGSRGCVTYSWEKLLLHFKLPNCLEMGHLVRETLAFMSTTSEKFAPVLDLMDGKSLRDLAIKRTKVDRHHQLLTGKFDQGSLWVPQPFQRAKLLEAVLRPPPSSNANEELDKEEVEKMCNGNTAKECIKVKTEGNQIYTFEANDNGTLDADLVDNIIKGTIALKFKVKDDVWRIVNRKGDVFPTPPDGWKDRDYIPIKRHVTPPNSPSKTPLTPANSLAPLTPLSTSMHQQHSSSTLTPADAMILEQIRQQFQNQMQLQEHFNNIVSQQTQKANKAGGGETREELLQRHGFR